MQKLFRSLSLFLILTCALRAEPDLEPFRIALAKQAQFRSVIVEIQQTKKMAALNEPVHTKGKLWLQPGKAFRWQLGEPIASTAIYDGTAVYLLNEKDKSAQSFPPTDNKVKPLLMMLGMGDGASIEAMSKVLRITGATKKNSHYAAAFTPKPIKLKRAIKQLVLQINTESSFTERIEWTQKDGSVVTTTFSKPKINAPLPPQIFSFNKAEYSWEN